MTLQNKAQSMVGSDWSLERWLAYISHNHPSEIELGLSRVKQVWNSLCSRHAYTPAYVVTVAGTNGKGSTIAMIEKGLAQLGYAAGCYTSPHILKYNERVRLNGIDASDEVLISSFGAVEASRDGIPLTYFEYGTLAALHILFSSKLDVLILEIGLGGRLDAVNVVDPDMAIITSIGFDHEEWLGNTLDKIAMEKAGIIRASSKVLLGKGLPSVIEQHAKHLGVEPWQYGRQFGLNNKGFFVDSAHSSTVLSTDAAPALPESNVALALQAICQVDSDLSKYMDHSSPNRFEFLNGFSMPGRFEKLSVADSTFYLDVGHNQLAAEYLSSRLQSLKEKGIKCQAVYSSLQDKDVASVVDMLSPFVDKWYLAPLDCDRALPLDELINKVRECASNVVSFNHIRTALEASLEQSKSAETVTLVFGSFYVVEAAKVFFLDYE